MPGAGNSPDCLLIRTLSLAGLYLVAAITPLNKGLKGSSSHGSGKIEKNSKKRAMKHMSALLRNV